MEKKYKIALIVSIIIMIFSIIVGSVAYYRKVVSGNITGKTGNAVFVLKDENSNVWNNKEITLGKVNPGDSGSFTVTLDASSSIVDMYATLEIERANLPTNLKFYTTPDHKSELHKYYSLLEINGTSTETLTIYWYWNPYLNDEEDTKFMNQDSLDAVVKANAIQINGYAMMKNGYSAKSEFWSDTYKPYVRTISFESGLNNIDKNCTTENLCWNISYDASQKNKVYGYLTDSGLKDSSDVAKTLYDLHIVADGKIFAPINSTSLFDSFTNLTAINFNDNFNTSKVTDMNALFYFCYNLEELDLSSFNTNNVTRMLQMFRMPHNSVVATPAKLKKLNVENFNTSKVTDMRYMFYYCRSLTELDLSSFNTSNVTNMQGVFWVLTNCASLNVSSFNTSKVTDMSFMFHCENLPELDVSGFNTSNVTNASAMFCLPKVKKLDVSGFNTSKVTIMSYMFQGCSSITELNISGFNTSNVTDMSSAFINCSSLKYLDLSNFNLAQVTAFSDGDGMFKGCANLTTTINITNANVTNYATMFEGAATASGAKIVVNYTTETETLVNNMIATKSANSNVVKGSLIS